MVQESTFHISVSPAATEVVQPVSVVSCDFIALLIVGVALAVMLSASVGG